MSNARRRRLLATPYGAGVGETEYHASVADRWADGLDDGWEPFASGDWSAGIFGSSMRVSGPVLLRRTALTPVDFDATIRFPNTSSTTGNSQFAWRWQGDSLPAPSNGYRLHWNNGITSQGIHLVRFSSGIETILDSAGTSPGFNRWLRIQVEGNRHRVKWWRASSTEPAEWQMDVVDEVFTNAGHIGFGAIPVGVRNSSLWSEMHVVTL